jgi:P-type E1-E2 ATPase
VPGDIVFLKEPIKIPFDGVLLEGSVLINECALTG